MHLHLHLSSPSTSIHSHPSVSRPIHAARLAVIPLSSSPLSFTSLNCHTQLPPPLARHVSLRTSSYPPRTGRRSPWPGYQTIDKHQHTRRLQAEELEEHRCPPGSGHWRRLLLQHEPLLRSNPVLYVPDAVAVAAWFFPTACMAVRRHASEEKKSSHTTFSSLPRTSPANDVVSLLSQSKSDSVEAESSLTIDSIKPKIREQKKSSAPAPAPTPAPAAPEAPQDDAQQPSPEAATLKSPEELEAEAGQEGAFNPETGEINWDCPCLGGMAHGPCGEEFKAAFSCFVYSSEEPKGIDCIEKFKYVPTF